MLRYVFSVHLRLAVHAALLFAVGLFVSWPIVHYRLRAVGWLPLAIFRLVVRLIGRSSSIVRSVAVIFGFNTLVIFTYMASGFLPLLPKLFGIWTGMDIGIVLGMARAGPFPGASQLRAGQWLPSRALTSFCGSLVLALELPCFWFSIAMGISMGHAAAAGAKPYAAALGARAAAYFSVIVPLLLCSAVAEAIAIRGMAAGPRSP